MKNTFILLFAITILGCNTGSSQKHGEQVSGDQNSSGQQQALDSVLGVHGIAKEISGQGRIEKEYYLIQGPDTSAFSCIVQQKTDSKTVSMLLRYVPEGKMPASISPRDTNAVVTGNSPGRQIKELSLKDQIQELRFILKGISKDYEFDSLKYIRTSIGAFRQLAVDITEEFTAKYGKQLDYKSNENVRQLLVHSTFLADLNQILKAYRITVSKVSVGELVYYLPTEKDLNTKRPDSDSAAGKVIDGLVVIGLSKGK